MSIDPKDFIRPTEPQEEGVPIGGTFVCQTCLEDTNSAVLNEDEMIIIYVCSLGHRNEATL
jgi:hypothetical protein